MTLTRGAAKDIELGLSGSYSMCNEILDHALVDVLPVSGKLLSFFKGSTGKYYNADKTNVHLKGQLPPDQAFLIKSVKVEYHPKAGYIVTPPHLCTILAFVRHATLSFRVEGRAPEIVIPLWRLFSLRFYIEEIESQPDGYTLGGGHAFGDKPIFIGQLVPFCTTIECTHDYSATLNSDEIFISFPGTLTKAK